MYQKSDTLCFTTVEYAKEAHSYLQDHNIKCDVVTLKPTRQEQMEQLSELRKKHYNNIIFYTYNKSTQAYLDKLKGYLLLTGAKAKHIVDSYGSDVKVTWPDFFIKSVPKLALEYGMTLLFIPRLILVPYINHKVNSFITVKRNKKVDLNAIDKVAYIRTDHWFGSQKAGGSIAHITGVANAFSELGYGVFFLSTDKIEVVNEDKMPVHVIFPSYAFFSNIHELPELIYNFKLVREAKKIFDKERPGLIYQRYSLNNYSALELSKMYDIPLITEYNGSMAWIGKNWGNPLKFPKVAENIELANLKAADLVVVVSDVMKEELLERGIEDNKILVNPNGVDPEKFSPAIDGSRIRKEYGITDETVIGFIGTFGRWHGIEVLAEAVRHVVDKRRDVHFLLIGDGMMMPKVKDILKRDNVEQYVTLTGLVPQDQAPIYLAACDILASPHVPNPDGTPFFGSPTKLFEYMAMSKGIVASDLDQIGDILKDGRSALMVKPGDVGQLSEGILRLVEDKELRDRLGRQAREDVINKYTWKKNVENVLRALEKVGDE